MVQAGGGTSPGTAPQSKFKFTPELHHIRPPGGAAGRLTLSDKRPKDEDQRVQRVPRSSRSASLLHGDHPDGHDSVREAVLPLHGEDLQAGLGDDDPHDVQVAADAAVDGVQLAALPRHVVLHDDDAIGTQAPPTANQEVQQVFVGQVT